MCKKRKRGAAAQGEVRAAKKELRKAIRRDLGKVSQQPIERTSRRPPTTRSSAVPTITHRGTTADNHEDKTKILVNISFPIPVPYDGDEGERRPPGTVYLAVRWEPVQAAF